MAHKYRQEDLTSPIFLGWLTKPSLSEYSSSNISRYSQSILSQSSLAEYFSLPGSNSSLTRSHHSLTSLNKDAYTRSNSNLLISEIGLSRSNSSLSGSIPVLSTSETGLTKLDHFVEAKSKSEMKLKTVRRSSTVETAETILRIDAFQYHK